MSKNGRDRLAEALEVLKTLQDRGPCYAIKGMKTLGEVNSRMLLENGFLEEVIKGWYIPSTPSHVGTTTTWYDLQSRYSPRKMDIDAGRVT